MKLSTLTNAKFIASSLKMVLALPVGLALRLRHPCMWIITERPDQARDNGLAFFRYLRKEHPEIDACYVIDGDAPDRVKMAGLGNIVGFNSWRHYVYYCASRMHISAHVGGCAPADAIIVKKLKGLLGFKDVFIPHGVSYGVAEFCLKKYADIDLFICSGKPEYENVLANYGYSKGEVAYTGFPRLDGWYGAKVDPRQIVVMPTWRLYIAQDPSVVFEETQYFKAYQALLNDPRLTCFLVKNDLHLVFYLHNEMQKYVGSFSTDCPNVAIARNDEYDIQELLKSSALLVTDYSSVHFDFAYMEKPVIYFQFDQDEFFSRQYEASGFHAESDGFGPVVYTLNALVDEIEESFKGQFHPAPEYSTRMHDFYQLHDDKNCERVFEAIGRLATKND